MSAARTRGSDLLPSVDGKRTRLDELAFQRWKGDRIVDERFVYDPASVAAN